MEKINSQVSLNAAILQLELQQAGEAKGLKEQFHLAYESVKPVNLIKSTFIEVAASEELKDKLINTSVGLAAGYLSKILFEGASHSPIRKLLGTVLLFGVTKAVTKNPEMVKAMVHGAFKIAQGIAAGRQPATNTDV